MIADFALSAGHNIDEIGTRALYTYAHDEEPTRQEMALEDAYTAEIRYFADCILNGKPTARASLLSSETTLKLVLAVKRSLETGEVVEF
jgi:predicted dehydrogenase